MTLIPFVRLVGDTSSITLKPSILPLQCCAKVLRPQYFQGTEEASLVIAHLPPMTPAYRPIVSATMVSLRQLLFYFLLIFRHRNSSEPGISLLGTVFYFPSGPTIPPGTVRAGFCY